MVPLLLSVGYHVKVDIARAVKSRPETRAAAPLGPDPRLAALLDQRLREAGVTDNDAVVLAAAGSSDPAPRRTSRNSRTGCGPAFQPDRGRLRRSAKPSVPDAVAMLRRKPGAAPARGSRPEAWALAGGW